jgi:hypothetical protein
MTETDLSYVAGLFDGEGYTGITSRTRANLTRYVASVVISNQSKETLEWIASLFGGGISQLKDRRTSRPCYSWYLTGEKMDVFLKSISPYVRIKKQEVDVVLQFRAVVPKSYKEYNAALERIQRECLEKCRWLKKNR